MVMLLCAGPALADGPSTIPGDQCDTPFMDLPTFADQFPGIPAQIVHGWYDTALREWSAACISPGERLRAMGYTDEELLGWVFNGGGHVPPKPEPVPLPWSGLLLLVPLLMLWRIARMPDLAGRGPLGQKKGKKPKVQKRVLDKARIEAIHGLPCVACREYGDKQETPTQAHHCISGRYSSVRAGDDAAIPLCEDHHQGDRGSDKVAIHKDKAAWEAKYGPDTGFIAVTDWLIQTGGKHGL
jgi:hypothetical protein